MYINIETGHYFSETGCYISEDAELGKTPYYFDCNELRSTPVKYDPSYVIIDAGFEEYDPDYESMPDYNQTASELAGYDIWGMAYIARRGEEPELTAEEAEKVARFFNLEISRLLTAEERSERSRIEREQAELLKKAQEEAFELEEFERIKAQNDVYAVVSGSSLNSFKKECSLYIKAGYRTAGGISVTERGFFQAFVR